MLETIKKDICPLGIGEGGKQLFDLLCDRDDEAFPNTSAMLKHLEDMDGGRYFRVPGDRCTCGSNSLLRHSRRLSQVASIEDRMLHFVFASLMTHFALAWLLAG